MKDYYDKEGNHPLLDTQCQFILNDEVEVIEDTPKENKKIEHLKLYAPYKECTDDRFEDIEDKINEIIDKINGE
jgi:hypothetical protein